MCSQIGGNKTLFYGQLRAKLFPFSDFQRLMDKGDADDKVPLHLALENGMYTRVEILLDSFGAGKWWY